MLAFLVRSRKICLGFIGFGGLHFSLMRSGLPSWPCPIRHGLGVPCPGCGLSRATIALLHGQADHALEIHAFSPIVLLMVGLMGIAIVLPNSKRFELIRWLERFEDRSRFTLVLMSSFLGYWLIRLFFFKDALYQLVM